MVNNFLNWLLGRVLGRLLGTSKIGPALTRYYLYSSKRFGIKVHYIRQSDKEFHTHPWNGWSLIFGRYTEITQGKIHTRWLFNRIYANEEHMVLVDRPVWTIFVHGPRINEEWYYGDRVKPWEGSDAERLLYPVGNH